MEVFYVVIKKNTAFTKPLYLLFYGATRDNLTQMIRYRVGITGNHMKLFLALLISSSLNHKQCPALSPPCFRKRERDRRRDKGRSGVLLGGHVFPVFPGPVGCQQRVEHGVIDGTLGRLLSPMSVHLPL